jgi:hypothetical protein
MNVPIYDKVNNVNYNIDFDIRQALLHDTEDGSQEYYLEITTNITLPDGGSFPRFVVRELTDVPEEYDPAADFTELCEDYIEYITLVSQIVTESSSSEE